MNLQPVPGSPWDGHDSYGDCRPITGGCTRRHQGQDIGAPMGAPVIAVADGLATKSESAAGGLGVNLQTTGADAFYYAHFGSYGKLGQVKAGDVIGYVGMTGSTTGPHLHFEHKRNGVNVNPAGFLSGATPSQPNPGTVGTTAGGLDSFIPGVDEAKDLVELLTAPIRLTVRGLEWLANRDNWVRIAQVLAGIALIGLGAVVLLRDVLIDSGILSRAPVPIPK